MTAAIGKSRNVHKARSRGAKRTRASTHSNPSRSPASKTASHLAGAAMRRRPVTRLHTIDEAAELLNVSPRTVRRVIKRVLYEHTGSGVSFALQMKISRHSSLRIQAAKAVASSVT